MIKAAIGFLDGVGGSVIRLVDYVGRVASMLGGTLYYTARLAIEWPVAIAQMSIMGVNSMFIVFLVVSFTGMFLALMATEQAVKFGTTQYLGGAIVYVMIRELVPVLTAVVMAGRVGSAIASELASMKVSEQIDALRSLATNPVQYLVVPRVVALVLMMPIVSLFAAFVSIMMSFLVANQAGGVEWVVFFSTVPDLVTRWLITGALIKTVAFALIISLVGCVEGMATEGGAVGVGKATINSVVVSMVLIFAANFILSMMLFPTSK